MQSRRRGNGLPEISGQRETMFHDNIEEGNITSMGSVRRERTDIMRLLCNGYRQISSMASARKEK